MDMLGNISCCFDASKDVGETSIELVVCNCPVTKRCCTRWEQVTYAMAVAFSLMDFIADLLGYVTFVDVVADPSTIQVYINVWLAFLIISGIILASEVLLPLYSIYHTCSCRQDQQTEDEGLEKLRRVTRYWNRVNSFTVILSEDGVIALVRILIAFKSTEAIVDLQSVQGQISAIMAFCITFFRHCFLIMQIIVKMGKNDIAFWRCPPVSPGYLDRSTKGLFLFYLIILFISCCALATTGMSMIISVGAMAIHVEDSSDFLLNTVLLSLSIPGSFAVSIFLVVLTRW